MVPVIRNVEGMNFTDIEKAINLLGEKVIFINSMIIVPFIVFTPVYLKCTLVVLMMKCIVIVVLGP